MLVSVSDCKTWLGISSTDTSNDDIIEDIIESVTDQFANELNRNLEVSTYTVYLDGTGTDSIFLPVYPIVSITSIHVDPDRVYGADTLLSTDDYIYYSETGEISRTGYGYFSKGKQIIKVVYVGGYTTSGTSITLPKDLQKAAKDQVKFLFKKWQNGDEAITSYSTLNNNVNLIEATDILPMARRTLDKYRNYYHG